MHRHLVTPLALLGLSFAAAAAPAADQAARRSPAGRVPHVSLGLTVTELPQVGPFGGLLVRDLTPDGPAARAGVQKGDVILRVSNRQVDDYDHLVNALAGHSPGDQ